MNKIIKENMYKNELNLSKYASTSKDAIRFKSIDDDIRNPYFRDIDKIIYSLSYSRYMDKTQVFSNKDNDHISRRMVHVQLVSKIARTIGRALNLNEDLIEAIALGHDIGHVPFGHTGERILNEISLKYTGTFFYHNIQSVRTLMNIEHGGVGNNLCVQTLDGIMCHNGEMLCNRYTTCNKTKEEFMKEYENSYTDPTVVKKQLPMTLEGCVVRISDVVGYIGRDIEDAIRLDVIKESDLDENIIKVLGKTNSEIVNTITMNIISNSYDKPYIEMSKDIFDSLNKLIRFNYKNIYQPAVSKEELENYKKMFNELFECYVNQINNEDRKSNIYKVFLSKMNSDYINKNDAYRKVIDYMAGMTDDYFINEYNDLKKN